eukprot:4185388-Lingulodinium_polyedra.AAC.1
MVAGGPRPRRADLIASIVNATDYVPNLHRVDKPARPERGNQNACPSSDLSEDPRPPIEPSSSM